MPLGVGSRGSMIVPLPLVAAWMQSHCASQHNDLGDLLYQINWIQYEVKGKTVHLLPSSPACDSSQKSALMGLAMVLSATQPAGKFFVLPPISLTLVFSIKPMFVLYPHTSQMQGKTWHGVWEQLLEEKVITSTTFPTSLWQTGMHTWGLKVQLGDMHLEESYKPGESGHWTLENKPLIAWDSCWYTVSNSESETPSL